MLKNLKEMMYTELNQTIKTIPSKIENINKEIESIKRNQIEILELTFWGKFKNLSIKKFNI
jgi:hypothetical protein